MTKEQFSIQSMILGTIIILMVFFSSACAPQSGSGSGGGSGSGSGSGGTPDFTEKLYNVVCLGQNPGTHFVQIHMQCNQNASSGNRNEYVNLNLVNSSNGGAGCDEVYNFRADILNQDSTYLTYCEFSINGVLQQQIAISPNSAHTFSNGYVQ
jgi:hypothetical protein